MLWIVLYHDEFDAWLNEQDESLQDALLFSIELLQAEGPMLGRPYVDTVKGSKYPNLKELRVQHRGEPWRVLFAFDPKRRAIILLGGNKTGSGSNWYKENIRIADKRFEEHLRSMKEEGK